MYWKSFCKCVLNNTYCGVCITGNPYMLHTAVGYILNVISCGYQPTHHRTKICWQTTAAKEQTLPITITFSPFFISFFLEYLASVKICWVIFFSRPAKKLKYNEKSHVFLVILISVIKYRQSLKMLSLWDLFYTKVHTFGG